MCKSDFNIHNFMGRTLYVSTSQKDWSTHSGGRKSVGSGTMLKTWDWGPEVRRKKIKWKSCCHV